MVALRGRSGCPLFALDALEAEERLPVYATAALRLMTLTGCRCSEIMTMRWEDVHLEVSESGFATARPVRAWYFRVIHSTPQCILEQCTPSRALQSSSASLSTSACARPPHTAPTSPSMTTVAKNSPVASDAWDIAVRWCKTKGDGWAPTDQLGLGGTAPVFEMQSPSGPRALKIYDKKFSSGELGDIEHCRIQQQLRLKDHDCPSLVHVYEGGMIEDRLYLLMSRAPGTELEKRLREVPRSQIRAILQDIAQACIFLQTRGLCHRDVKAANIFVSDDFSHATLLDISVIRAIHDPVGVGTDHDGQLPILATARYSPPEYLFRLVEPSPSLWHALTVYQLGALLHDLIVGIPLFQAEYEQSKTNRYRFAWVVATQDPRIDASTVDHDLLFLARRALDKDWNRRSALRIEDFLDDSTRRQQHAYQMLGLFRGPIVQPTSNVQPDRMRLDEISNALETHLIAYFRDGGVTAVHQVVPDLIGDNFRTVVLKWNTKVELGSTVAVSLRCTLRRLTNDLGKRLGMAVGLSKEENGKTKSFNIDLPDIPDDEHSSSSLAHQAEAAVAGLATDLSRADKMKH